MRKSLILTVILLVVAITVTQALAESTLIYTVKKGDTLWSISKQHGVSMEAILAGNPELKNEKSLKQGMSLAIPNVEDDAIPVEVGTTETHTLVVHGSYNPAAEQAINQMTVDGKTIKVPLHKPKVQVASNKGNNYKSKYHNLSSRGLARGNSIVKTAFKYKGVPYIFGGSTPSGFDCSGFIQYVYRENGIKTPRMAHHQYYAGTPVSKKNLRPGDLVFFETYTAGISHVGIYIGNNQFIHASSRGAVRVNSLGQQYYTNRYRGAARYYK
ncbi:MAG: NlpC/P60 family protein [Vulcanimicrobiota bacterium]